MGAYFLLEPMYSRGGQLLTIWLHSQTALTFAHPHTVITSCISIWTRISYEVNFVLLFLNSVVYDMLN